MDKGTCSIDRHETQIPPGRKFSKEVNARLRLKPMQVINEERMDYWLPENERYRRYRNKNGHYSIWDDL